MKWGRRAWSGCDGSRAEWKPAYCGCACLFHDGDRAGAAAEFAKVRALHPPNLDQLEKRYATLLH